MNAQSRSMGEIFVGKKRCCPEVRSIVGGGFYNFIHTNEKNEGCPQGVWNVHDLVGPFVERRQVGVGTYMGTRCNFLGF